MSLQNSTLTTCSRECQPVFRIVYANSVVKVHELNDSAWMEDLKARALLDPTKQSRKATLNIHRIGLSIVALWQSLNSQQNMLQLLINLEN